MKTSDCKQAARLLRDLANYADDVGPRALRGSQDNARRLADKLEKLGKSKDFKRFIKQHGDVSDG